MQLSRWFAVVAVGAAVANASPTRAQPDVSDLLTRSLGFTAKDRQAIDRGEVVARALAADADEVAIAAAALVAVPRTYYLERFRAIVHKMERKVEQLARRRARADRKYQGRATGLDRDS